MTTLVVLDAGVIGLVTHPNLAGGAVACNAWLDGLLARTVPVAVPEIADYEVRRELLRADKLRSIRALDVLKAGLLYIPLTTGMMLKSAELWAMARKQGKPTASPDALDGDAILAAQALVIGEIHGYDIVVATTNVGHLSRFIRAETWNRIALP